MRTSPEDNPFPSLNCDREAGLVVQFLERVLGLMGVEGEVHRRGQGSTEGAGLPPLVLDLEVGDDASLVIGRRGLHLEALQLVANRYAGKLSAERDLERACEVGAGSADGEQAAPLRVVLDCCGYRERRQDDLRSMARRLAEKASANGVELRLVALSAAERKVIHSELQAGPAGWGGGSGEPVTRSEGTGVMRALVLGGEDSALECTD